MDDIEDWRRLLREQHGIVSRAQASRHGFSDAAVLTHIGARRPRRYLRACREAVRLLREGVTSPLEARYVLDVESAHGLPRARHQTPFAVDASTVFEDCLYTCPAGLVVVRLDGHRYHADPAVRLRDRRRGNAAELAGRARLEYGWDEVTRTPCRTAREVAAVLQQHGWAGDVGGCAACAHFLRS